MSRLFPLIALILLVFGATASPRQADAAVKVSAPLFGTYAGVDFPSFERSFTHCGALWTWLIPICYSDATGSSGVSVQGALQDDINWVAAQHLGSFHRVWISLDQLLSGFDVNTGSSTFDPVALANFDDAMSKFAAANIKLDLVLYTNSNSNGFQPRALDGKHDVMMANYIQALADFMTHIRNNVSDAKVVAVADLMNEAYYQLEQYFLQPANLGIWAFARAGGTLCDVMGNTICDAFHAGSDGHGCGTGPVDTTCIDVNIVYPFLQAEYHAAHTADPDVKYTVSAAGGGSGPLSTSTGAFTSQAFYESEYPVDIYDIHLYAGQPTANLPYTDGPWGTTQLARLQEALTLNKPWFSGETGCGTGNTACTYGGSTNQGVDQFWLSVAWQYGAQAVLIEASQTAWSYSSATGGVIVYAITPVGQQIAYANGIGAQFRNITLRSKSMKKK